MREIMLTVLFVVALLWTPAAAALTWTTEYLPPNDWHKWSLHVSDGCVAWAAHGYGQDDEIYYFDGTTIHQLTDNSAGEVPHDMDGGAVVWTSAESGISQVYVYRNGVTTRLDTPGREALFPRISGQNVAWIGRAGADDLFVYDGTTIQQVTDDSYADWTCDISGSRVAWQRWDGSGYEVFTHDLGGGMQNLSNSSRWAFRPRIDGDTIAWVGEVRPNVRNDVFCYCGGIRQLTNLGYLDHYVQPEVSGTKVVWSCEVGGEYKLLLYDCVTSITTELASSPTYRYYPQIDGDYVVWSEHDGHDHEIFLYDGVQTYQITDNDIGDGGVCVSGNTLAWISTLDVYGNSQISIATLVPEPSTALLLVLGAVLAAGPRRRRRG